MSRGHVGNAIGVVIVFTAATAVYVTLSGTAEVDLRYEAGRPYRAGDQTICWLKLENFGWHTLDDVAAQVHFPVPLVDVAPADRLQSLEVAEGGTGHRHAHVKLAQLGPGEVCYVYFAAAGPEAEALLSDALFVDSATHSAGVARPGRPGLAGWTPATGALLVLVVGAIGYMVVLTYQIQDVNYLMRRAREDLKMNERLVGMVTSRNPRGTQADSLRALADQSNADEAHEKAQDESDDSASENDDQPATTESGGQLVPQPHSRKSRRRSRKR